MYIGIAVLLTAMVDLSFYYTETFMKITTTIFQVSESLFILSIVLLIVDVIYKAKKEKDSRR